MPISPTGRAACCALLIASACASRGAGIEPEWRRAVPGWQYVFPRDHGPHAEFKTEWWYFTGNVTARDGRELGYELTFFRHGVRPPGERRHILSRWVVNDLKFAHFAVSDVRDGTFHFVQRQSRGAFREAGFGEADRLAWIGGWEVRLAEKGGFKLRAEDPAMAVELALTPVKPPALHGQNGVSVKAKGPGRASHYYSMTRLGTAGTVRLGGMVFAVSGASWFDHEWATNQLGPDQEGWDWFSIQFDDGTELMLYQMRLKGGGIDPHSSGTLVRANGETEHLLSGEYRLTPFEKWRSAVTGAEYPIRWRLEVPRLALDAEVSTPMKNQELAVSPISYWEGAIHVRGRKGESPILGTGYMELTGYAGSMVGIGGTGR